VVVAKIVMGSPLSNANAFDADAEEIVLKLVIVKKAIMQAAIMEKEIIVFFIVFYFGWLKNECLLFPKGRNFNAKL
jgi:hypothetical protein